MNTTTAATIAVIALVFATMALIMNTTSRPKPPPLDNTRLARLERQQQAILDHLGIAVPEPDMPEVMEFLMRGQKIQAIKAYREATSAGLKEAKDAVEEIAHKHGL